MELSYTRVTVNSEQPAAIVQRLPATIGEPQDVVMVTLDGFFEVPSARPFVDNQGDGFIRGLSDQKLIAVVRRAREIKEKIDHGDQEERKYYRLSDKGESLANTLGEGRWNCTFASPTTAEYNFRNKISDGVELNLQISGGHVALEFVNRAAGERQVLKGEIKESLLHPGYLKPDNQTMSETVWLVTP